MHFQLVHIRTVATVAIVMLKDILATNFCGEENEQEQEKEAKSTGMYHFARRSRSNVAPLCAVPAPTYTRPNGLVFLACAFKASGNNFVFQTQKKFGLLSFCMVMYVRLAYVLSFSMTNKGGGTEQQ